AADQPQQWQLLQALMQVAEDRIEAHAGEAGPAQGDGRRAQYVVAQRSTLRELGVEEVGLVGPLELGLQLGDEAGVSGDRASLEVALLRTAALDVLEAVVGCEAIDDADHRQLLDRHDDLDELAVAAGDHTVLKRVAIGQPQHATHAVAVELDPN